MERPAVRAWVWKIVYTRIRTRSCVGANSLAKRAGRNVLNPRFAIVSYLMPRPRRFQEGSTRVVSPRSLIARMTLLVTLIGSLLSGCTEELSPAPMPTTRVRGHVTEAGQPMSGGWIEFLPTDGTIGVMRSAPLQKDGSFDAEGVPVGQVAIGLVGAPITQAYRDANGRLLPGRIFFDSLGAKIRRTIPSEGLADLTLELRVEADRWIAEVTRNRHQ